MNAYSHITDHTRPFFEGWYFKHQSDEHTLILIPAFHRSKNGQESASLQIILDDISHWLTFPSREFSADPHRLYVQIGQNIFSEKGCRLHLDLPGIKIRGHLRYGSFHAPKRSLMGPFRALPLPCFHEVLSLFHSLRGLITVNGRLWDFSGASGYLEKDWGNSFPASYLWLQCSWQEPASRASVMLAIADLNTLPHPLTACAGLVLHQGRQYRLSTYQGARLTHRGGRRIALRQGPYLLQVILPGDLKHPLSDANAAGEAFCPSTAGQPAANRPSAGPSASDTVFCPSAKGAPLLAPQEGQMSRVIRERSRYPMRCQLYKGGQKILDAEKEWGSLEQV